MSNHIIDIKEVMDYCFCPMYYYQKKNKPEQRIITNLYDEKLHQCFYGYLNQMKNSNYADLKYLKKIWGKVWIKEKTNTSLIVNPSPNADDTYNNKRKQGIDAIISFHQLMSQVDQYPVIINNQYSVKITENITLTGLWEYIREVKVEDSSEFQIVKFYTMNNRFSTLMQMRHDLELTAASYAFTKIFKDIKPGLVYMNIYKNRSVDTYRDEKDYALLKRTVKNAVACIENKIFTICPDTKCFHCEYRKECEKEIKKG